MTDAATIARQLRAAKRATQWQRGLDLDYATCWEDDPLHVAAADLIERQNAELAALRAERNSMKLLAKRWQSLYLRAIEERDSLRAELERERMRLAACGVVALADTPASAARAREMHDAYRSASCDDVARRVDECMALRAERDALQQALPQFQHLRKPLTKVQITELAEKCGYDGAVPTVRLAYQGFRLDAFARAIERAHGITGETE